MEIHLRKNGARSFREKVYVNGRPITKSFTRKTDAESWKRRMIADRDRSEALGVSPNKEIRYESFQDLWNERRSIVWAITTKSRYLGLQRIYLKPQFQGRMIRELTREVVEEFAATLRRNSVTSVTVDQCISLLRTMLNDAVQWDYLKANPACRFPKTAEKVLRENYWNEEEARTFLKGIEPDSLFPLYFMAIKTGMRRGELAGLKWSAVNFATNNITVCRIRDRYGLRETTKTRVKREIPMNADIRRVLGELYKARKSDFVFIRPDGSPVDIQHVYRAFQKAQKGIGMTKIIHFHDLRHTFASIFLMRGGNLHAGAKIMGHSKVSMTDRYGHIAQTHLSQEMEKMCFEPAPARTSPKLAHENVC